MLQRYYFSANTSRPGRKFPEHAAHENQDNKKNRPTSQPGGLIVSKKKFEPVYFIRFIQRYYFLPDTSRPPLLSSRSLTLNSHHKKTAGLRSPTVYRFKQTLNPVHLCFICCKDRLFTGIKPPAG
jgi:hypothetical protein